MWGGRDTSKSEQRFLCSYKVVKHISNEHKREKGQHFNSNVICIKRDPFSGNSKYLVGNGKVMKMD